MQLQTASQIKTQTYTRASQPDLHNYLMPWVLDGLQKKFRHKISTDCEQPDSKAKNEDAWLQIERKKRENASNRIVLERKFDGYINKHISADDLDVAFEVYTNCPLKLFSTTRRRYSPEPVANAAHTQLADQIRTQFVKNEYSEYYGLLLASLPENHYTIIIKMYNLEACDAEAYLIDTKQIATMYRTMIYTVPYAATSKKQEPWQNICACFNLRKCNRYFRETVIVSSMIIPPSDFKQYYII